MATWPSSLPAPLLGGNQLTPVDQSMRTEMEVGAARSRRVTHAANDRLLVGWSFSDSQMDEFRAWFDDDTEAAGGSAWFSVGLRIGRGGVSAVEARFVGAFQASPVGVDRWSVSATIEVR